MAKKLTFNEVKAEAKKCGFKMKKKGRMYALEGARQLAPNVGMVCAPCLFRTLKKVMSFLYQG